MMIPNATTVAALAALLLAATGCGSSPSGAPYSRSSADAPSNRKALAGTYYYEGGDSGGYQKITLTLRSDGTYTKVLNAAVPGLSGLGGTHSGTWTASGTSVTLSGDGNFPAFTHDLSAFRKIG